VDKDQLKVYNTLLREKEAFKPLNTPFVGMYVCGPTVYGDAHLGHARPYITFDLVYRFLTHLGYKVRYVRNITDVGHLENDADHGEDKIAKKARLEQLEPMEVVHYYTMAFRKNMRQLNNLPPSIEPCASGHIIEQIEMIEEILDKGYGYLVNGSVYFDVSKYNEDYNYGKLSGRKIEDLLSATRELEGQQEKKSSLDFALWKKASPEHIMRWPSPWSDGFPGWHLECSVMSTKYLGNHFDIHGGGMDLLFPHHECEIAQSKASKDQEPAKYWMHNNMITINGQKMGKSLGNFITLDELFDGSHEVVAQAYEPMTVRFFILQAHYRSTLDFSNDGLRAAEKGMKRLFEAYESIESLPIGNVTSGIDVADLTKKCEHAMCDDFNSPMVIATLFDGVKSINAIKADNGSITEIDRTKLQDLYRLWVFDILGLKVTSIQDNNSEVVDQLMQTIIEIRKESRTKKDFATADLIRERLSAAKISLKDSNEGTTWSYEA